MSSCLPDQFGGSISTVLYHSECNPYICFLPQEPTLSGRLRLFLFSAFLTLFSSFFFSLFSSPSSSSPPSRPYLPSPSALVLPFAPPPGLIRSPLAGGKLRDSHGRHCRGESSIILKYNPVRGREANRK